MRTAVAQQRVMPMIPISSRLPFIVLKGTVAHETGRVSLQRRVESA